MSEFTTAEANSQKLLGEDGVRTAGFLQLPIYTQNRLQSTTTQQHADMMAGKPAARKTPSLPCRTGESFCKNVARMKN